MPSAVIVFAPPTCRSVAVLQMCRQLPATVLLFWSSCCAALAGHSSHCACSSHAAPAAEQIRVAARPAGCSGAEPAWSATATAPCRLACAAHRAGWRSACTPGRSEAPIRGTSGKTGDRPPLRKSAALGADTTSSSTVPRCCQLLLLLLLPLLLLRHCSLLGCLTPYTRMSHSRLCARARTLQSAPHPGSPRLARALSSLSAGAWRELARTQQARCSQL